MKKQMINQALDLDTYVKVRNAAPHARFDYFSIAPDLLTVLEQLSKKLPVRKDPRGMNYWRCEVREIRAATHEYLGEDLSVNLVGRALNAIGIITWRANRAATAWSQDQIDELKKVFSDEPLPGKAE